MTDTLFELRRYRLVPGAREALIALFDDHLVAPQEAVGMRVVGQFRDPAAPDAFVWIRGFDDHPARVAGLTRFYGGPDWAGHAPAANATMLAWDDVLMLKPASDAPAFAREPEPVDRGRHILVAIHHLDAAATEADAAAIAATAAEAARDAGAAMLASLISDRTPNGYPRLPVREGECVAVTVVRADESAAAAAMAALAAVAAKRCEIARLMPTARSRLR